MTALTDRPNRNGTLAVGGLLVLIGLAALAMTYADIDPSRWLDGSGWTLFILAPGAIMLSAGLLTDRPSGEGLAIAGSIVTTIGLMLLVMDRTGSWESWAYAWALIPAGAGVGVLLRGARDGDRSRVIAGVRVVLVSLAVLVVGGWYFQTIFRTGEPPFEFGVAWPVVLIVIGAIVALAGLLRGRRHGDQTTA